TPSSRRRAAARSTGGFRRALARQFARAHQRFVDGPGGLAAFADRPDDEALPAAHVAAGEDVRLARGVASRAGGDIAASVQSDARAVEQTAALGAGEAHREQDQVGPQREFAAFDLVHASVTPFDAHAFEAGDFTVLGNHALRQHGPVAVHAFLVAGGRAQLERPVGPGQRLVFLLRRLGHDLELGHACGALAVGGADAVAAGVAAADHDHVLARRRQRAARGGAHFVVARVALVLLGQEFHRQPHARKLGARNVELARLLRAAGQHDRVEILLQRAERNLDADFAVGAELDPFGLHLHRTAVDEVLLHLEV